MLARNRPFLLLIPALVLAGCAQRPNPPAPARLPRSSNITRTLQDDPELNQAVTRARESLDSFVRRLQNPDRAEVFSVEAAFPTPEGKVEYLWIGDAKYKDGVFSGTLTSHPKNVTTVKYQEPATAKRADVTDWMILRSGRSEGGFTVDVLMRREAQPH